MLGLVLGIVVILLGVKAFTPKGLPLTSQTNLTGTPAKVIGVVCILLGLVFITDGLFAALRMATVIGGGGR